MRRWSSAAAITACQCKHSWQGAYGEIGAFYGWFLSLMALNARSVEGVIAFNDFMNSQYPDLSENLSASHAVPVPRQIWSCIPMKVAKYLLFMEI